MRKRGTGTYWQDKKSGRWQWRISITDHAGIRHRKKVTAISLEELTKKVEIWQKSQKGSHDIKDVDMEQLGKLFLATSKYSIRGKTYIGYRSNILNYIIPQYRHRNIKSIKPYEIQNWLHSMKEKKAPSTIATVKRVLSVMMNFALINGLLDRNPVVLVKLPKHQHKAIKIITVDKMRELLNLSKNIALEESDNIGKTYLNKLYFVFIWTLTFTGCRSGELASVMYSDIRGGCLYIHRSLTVDYDGRSILSPSTKTLQSTRTIKLDEKTLNILKYWTAYQKNYKKIVGNYFDNRRGLVFCNTRGGIISRTDMLRRYWHPLLEKLNIDKQGLHLTRRFHASFLAQSGITLPLVAARLGHADCTVLERYYLGAVESQDVIIEALGDLELITERDDTNDTRKKAPGAATPGDD